MRGGARAVAITNIPFPQGEREKIAKLIAEWEAQHNE